MRSYSPGGPLIAFAATRKGSIPPTSSGHRLQPGLPGYLIPFAPLAFAHERQNFIADHLTGFTPVDETWCPCQHTVTYKDIGDVSDNRAFPAYALALLLLWVLKRCRASESRLPPKLGRVFSVLYEKPLPPFSYFFRIPLRRAHFMVPLISEHNTCSPTCWKCVFLEGSKEMVRRGNGEGSSFQHKGGRFRASIALDAGKRTCFYGQDQPGGAAPQDSPLLAAARKAGLPTSSALCRRV